MRRGLKNCTEALKQIVGYAEQKKVTICMELLNSKRNHKDYMCDRTEWGVKLCKAVGSERFKLLYDIYTCRSTRATSSPTIRENKDYIGHYHTAGVPGRHEIDESQELNYPRSCAPSPTSASRASSRRNSFRCEGRMRLWSRR
jgi:hydroxypyruvate isomerase